MPLSPSPNVIFDFLSFIPWWITPAEFSFPEEKEGEEEEEEESRREWEAL